MLMIASISEVGCDKLGLGKKKDETSADGTSKKSKKDDDDDSPSKKKDDKPATSAAAAPEPGAPSVGGPATKATSHLPSDCQIVVHVSVTKLVQNPSLGKEVMPLLDQMLAMPAPKDASWKEFEAFVKDASIDPRKTISDVAICVTEIGSGAKWGMTVGGTMAPGTIIPAFEKHKPATSKMHQADVSGLEAYVSDGLSVVQLTDGTVALAGKEDGLARLVPSSDAAAAYKLDPSKEIAFTVTESGMKAALGSGKKAPDEFASVRRADGYIDLTAGKSFVRLACGTPDAAKKLDALLTLMKDKVQKEVKDDRFGQSEALSNASSRMEGGDVIIESTVSPAALDKLAASLAAELRKAKDRL